MVFRNILTRWIKAVESKQRENGKKTHRLTKITILSFTWMLQCFEYFVNEHFSNNFLWWKPATIVVVISQSKYRKSLCIYFVLCGLCEAKVFERLQIFHVFLSPEWKKPIRFLCSVCLSMEMYTMKTFQTTQHQRRTYAYHDTDELVCGFYLNCNTCSFQMNTSIFMECKIPVWVEFGQRCTESVLLISSKSSHLITLPIKKNFTCLSIKVFIVLIEMEK